MIADLDCEKIPAEALQDVDSARCDGVEELFVGNVSVSRSEDGNKVVNEYTFAETLGRGSFGKVKRCVDGDGTSFAVKIYSRTVLSKRVTRFRNQSSGLGIRTAWDDVASELAALEHVRGHLNVARIVKVLDGPDELVYVPEYCSGGPIMVYVRGGSGLYKRPGTNDGCLANDEIVRYAEDVVLALRHIHGLGVVHRDVKPDNLLLGADGRCVLSDFGSAKILQGSAVNSGLVRGTAGTYAFLSPEACKGGGAYDAYATDVWSLGASIHAMVCGRVPFWADAIKPLFDTIASETYKVPAGASPRVVRVLWGIMGTKDPGKRMRLCDVAAVLERNE